MPFCEQLPPFLFIIFFDEEEKNFSDRKRLCMNFAAFSSFFLTLKSFDFGVWQTVFCFLSIIEL